MSAAIITPTVGRVVHLYRPRHGTSLDSRKPMSATIAHVWDDRTVNIAYFDHVGTALSDSKIHLVQADDQPPAPLVVHGHVISVPYVVWPPRAS
jgi:hypothetical protein